MLDLGRSFHHGFQIGPHRSSHASQTARRSVQVLGHVYYSLSSLEGDYTGDEGILGVWTLARPFGNPLPSGEILYGRFGDSCQGTCGYGGVGLRVEGYALCAPKLGCC